MRALLIVLLILGYFLSAGRVKGMSSQDLRDERNAKRPSRLLSFMKSFAPYAPVAEVLIGCIGLITIGILIWQTKVQTEALQLEATSAIYSGILDLDKIFLEKPELRPYFYEGVVIEPTAVNYDKVLSIAEYKLDLFDLFWQHSDHLRERQDWVAWKNWISESFAKSPIMCTHLNTIQDMYGEGIVNFAVDNCPSGIIKNNRQRE
jgi:hypothetical protein